MLYEISLEEKTAWESIVKGFADCDIYYLPDYVKAFAENGDGKSLLFYYEERGLKAANVVMLRDLAEDIHFRNRLKAGEYFDLATPYGYGGFLLQGASSIENKRALDESYTQYCKNRGIISEFVRFHPVLKNQEPLSDIYEIEKIGSTVTIHLGSREQMLANLSVNNRNKLRKAQKAGVKIEWGNSEQLYDRFMEMYGNTMRRNGASDYYYFQKDFFDCVRKELKDASMLFYAVYKNEIIAMSIVLFSNDKMHYHLSAMEESYKNLAPVNLLLFEAALYGAQRGCREFHLGGGVGSREDSLFQFKIGFCRDGKNEFYIGKKIIDMQKYQKLIEMRADDGRNTDYFPLYRG